MSKEILVATSRAGESVHYLLEVLQEGDHWTSTLARLDEHGEPCAEAAAPRFYGTTPEQARRWMITVLENQFDEVRVADTR